jgi:hypothetical protein
LAADSEHTEWASGLKWHEECLSRRGMAVYRTAGYGVFHSDLALSGHEFHNNPSPLPGKQLGTYTRMTSESVIDRLLHAA